MAFPTDWDVYKENASMFVGVDPVAPILGAGSLVMHRNGTAGRYANVMRAASTGFTSGVMRCLLTIRAAHYTGTNQWGILFQQSQADLAGATGEAYFAALHKAGTQEVQVALHRLTAGLATKTQLAITTAGIPTWTGSRALEVRWVLDLAGMGGLHVQIACGTLLDFSDLAPALNTVLTTSVLTSSVGQGLGISLGAADSPGAYGFDQVSCEPLVVA